MKKLNLIGALSISALLFASAATFMFFNQSSTDVVVVAEQGEPSLTSEQRYPYIVQPGSTFSAALKNLDITAQEIHQLVQAAKPVLNFSRLNGGTRFQVIQSESDPQMFLGVRVKISPREVVVVQKNTEGVWTTEKVQKTVETKVVTFMGVVKSSLWESAVEAQMSPSLISELAEVFAWQVDFAREVQIGDRWRLSVEEEFVQGEKIGWGAILSAEYENSGVTHTAVLYRKDGEDLGYFAPDGSSLRRMFLKSPIQYGRISSRFQRARFHPVLKVYRPHLGVDYAAPTGTPIRGVGSGTVEAMGYNSSAGNFMRIRHNSVYTTAYKHMSRFAKGMKRGSKIQQGQTIGYVGSTGLSTGPHLHFEFYVNGAYVDPLGQKFPSADPVPKDQLSQFVELKKIHLAYLPRWEMDRVVSQD